MRMTGAEAVSVLRGWGPAPSKRDQALAALSLMEIATAAGGLEKCRNVPLAPYMRHARRSQQYVGGSRDTAWQS